MGRRAPGGPSWRCCLGSTAGRAARRAAARRAAARRAAARAYVRFGNTETGLLKLVKGRGKWSPSGATAAAVAGEEEEAEEEGEEGEEEDAPKGKLKEQPGDYPFARQQDCDLRLFDFEAFGGFGKEVRSTLREAANQLSNKLSHAQHLDEVTWTTKNWHGLQMQRLSVVLHTAVAWQTVNELASEMENTDMNNMNTDAKIKTDALGVLPEPLNGGTTANRQLMAHIGPIRAAIASKLGVKLDHMRISNKMWNVLKELEAEDRINAVKKMEKEKDIHREISRGKFVVFMSTGARAAGMFAAKTLEETLEDRAARIEIPEEVLAKIDACWQLEEQYKTACTQLHEDSDAVTLVADEDGEDKSVTAPAFTALLERAKMKKQQDQEEKAAMQDADKIKIEQLLKSEEAELSLLEDKLDEQRRRKTSIDAELAKEKDQRDTLEKEAVALARVVLKSEGQEARDKDLRKLRVKNLEAINEKEEEATKLEDSIEQYKKEKAKREVKIAKYRSKIVSAPRTLTPEQEIDELYETLELYDGRLLDLEGRQSFVESEAERAVQKVGAFWIARLAQADAREAEADAKASDLRAVLDRLGEGSAAGKADAAPERKAKAVVDVVKEKAEEEKPAKEAVEEAAVKDAGAAVAVGAATEAPKTTAEVATETKTAATDEKGGGDKAAAGGEELRGGEEAAAGLASAGPAASASLPSMQERYASAEAAGEYVHVAQYEEYDGVEYGLRSAMSQLPDEPPRSSPLHPDGELRTKLTGLSLPTTGLRAELEARYDYAMRLERAKTQQWDPAAQAWVQMPIPMQ
ncbi:hypothetical protein EMIHUDRAFT_113625 [Emiliania huxleyi CCMP1516]|uniref:Uncharacterized protein n=2 Tax=Emiliania huxleyi TaxID=2903 RepID=A0A0D3K1T6_EMIH1|nr:hypothetical protein EMIHUDRAFT_113625 [Emiliania huxleyi CCMP1516]EOD29721.1 hypothetical protein EMIHUDRAFT_113625 [Emiliania huxleyi CCMP1516]|eukprot:XP_005782150.1 hypothetical protein EMIHUDRAFT_113625 [Emiliania huxleyi CCMP1516]